MYLTEAESAVSDPAGRHGAEAGPNPFPAYLSLPVPSLFELRRSLRGRTPSTHPGGQVQVPFSSG